MVNREEHASYTSVNGEIVEDARPRYDIRRVVGTNIRSLRLEAGLAQDVLATRMGVDQAYVSKLEAGKRNPTITTISYAARALGVEVSTLFLTEGVRSAKVSAWPGDNITFIKPVHDDSDAGRR
ncbi:helix-turn-helix transcriptional regulator [Phaeovibrio sulfidiphilus]|uniref:Helix-turn-helix transcriptional regulator n=1 Tax=Phaeovibrio sulfidiphilus TaxID=1220600 RepID=A0A8J6YMP2_9PROT|nr:helix-turn-helix transcriptional regulator [Phaeovibrio sulfidiphilus]MBE1237558.1 helix-turn-helix transcriptional regulator [Phaeovibrio sulfidiphilus]